MEFQSPAKAYLSMLQYALCIDNLITGEHAEGFAKSPNNIKYLRIGNTEIEVVLHVPVERYNKQIAWNAIVDFNSINIEELLDGLDTSLSQRSCQNLEGVFYSEGNIVGKKVAEYFKEKTQGNRFHTMGSLPDIWGGAFREDGSYYGEEKKLPPLESLSLETESVDKEWWRHIGTHSTYKYDEKIRKVLEELKNSYLGEDEEEADEVDLFSEDPKEEEESEAIEYFHATIAGTTSKILGEYDKIFASGYELLHPVGILVKKAEGRYRLLSLDSENKVEEKQSKIINQLGKSLDSRLNLVFSEQRGMGEIAETIAKSRTGLTEHLCFPYKLLEYAYGRKHCLDDSRIEKGVYENHATSIDWWKYKEAEVRPSISNLLLNLVESVLIKNDLIDNYESQEAEELVDIALKNSIKSLTSCVLVSVLDIFKGVPAKLKVRVLDSYGSLQGASGDKNLATEVFVKALNTDGGKDANSAPIVKRGIFFEYTHEYNHTLANAEPLFAPQALYALREKGETVSWENLILGKDSDDNILKANTQKGQGVNFISNLLHWIVAGSRSGKGVMTMNLLTGVIMSQRALFYVDDKPDIASLLRYLGPNGFILNGPSISYNPEAGFDYYKQFVDANSWFKKENIPGYLVPTVFTDYSYSSLGVMTYMRSVLFTMGILLARVKVDEKKHLLGGDKGIAIVYDEIANASEKFNTWYYRNVRGNLANSAYFTEFEEHQKATAEYEAELAKWKENGEVGSKPRKPGEIKAAHVSEAQYWFLCVRNSIASSFDELWSESRAGLRNIEAGVSDIFALTQELPDVLPVGGVLDDLLVKRNKVDNNPNTTPKNKEILASLMAVCGMDGFFGYNAGWKNVLGQKDRGTVAFDKLDSKARNFAYVKSVSSENYRNIVEGDKATAEGAIYFKPFLLLIEGNEPFTVKAREYVESAGLDWDDIVRRNEKEKGSGNLDPAVGFAGYLQELGLERTEVSKVLSQSGQIAQTVVDALGYPGTWRDFIHDLRPEWIFSVKDIREAMQGVPLRGKYREDIKEFLTVYPEQFPEIVKPGSENNAGADEYEGAVVSNYRDMLGNGFGYEDNSVVQDVKVGQPVSPVDPMGGQINVTPEMLGWNEARSTSREALNLPGIASEITDTEELPSLNGGMLNTFTEDSVISRNQWADVGVIQPGLSKGHLGVEELKALVTQAILGKYGIGSIRKLAVSGGVLLVNDQPISVNFNTGVLAGIGSVESAKLQAGLIADLFNWGTLDSMSSLEFLKIDSSKFLRGVVLPEAGIHAGRDGGVRNLFNSLDGLKKLNIAGNVYTREGLNQETGGLRFLESLKNQYVSERNSFFFTTMGARGTKGVYNWTAGRFRSGKTVQGLLGIGAVGVGAGLTVGAGALGLAWEAGKGIRNILAEALREGKG